jgi:Nudix hydrolase domain
VLTRCRHRRRQQRQQWNSWIRSSNWLVYSCLLLVGATNSLEYNNSNHNNNHLHHHHCHHHHHQGATTTTSPLFMSTTILTSQCQDDDNQNTNDLEGDNNEIISLEIPPFPDSVLSYDPYNGVTLDLGKFLNWQTQQQQQQQPPSSPNENETRDSSTISSPSILSSNNNTNIPLPPMLFRQSLDRALEFWKGEGRKGIWIHVPPIAAHWIPDCIQAGFDFHNVLREENKNKETILPTTSSSSGDNDDPKPLLPPPLLPPTLVLSQWLPNTPSKLPLGPTHQVGVGVVVLNPSDPSQMLCVQEQTGPGKSYMHITTS